MDSKQLLNELLDIEASASLLQRRCYNMRKKLERVNAPAPRKGKKAEEAALIAKMVAKREKYILRQIEKGKQQQDFK